MTTLASLTAASAQLAATLKSHAVAVENMANAPMDALRTLRGVANVQIASFGFIAQEARRILEEVAAAQAEAQAAIDALAGVVAPPEEAVDLSLFGVPIRPATPEEEMDAISDPAEEMVDLAAPTPEQVREAVEAVEAVEMMPGPYNSGTVVKYEDGLISVVHDAPTPETIQARAANAPTNGRKRKSK